jgi:hypothetical protein
MVKYNVRGVGARGNTDAKLETELWKVRDVRRSPKWRKPRANPNLVDPKSRNRLPPNMFSVT